MSNIVPFDTPLPAHVTARSGQPSVLGDAISGGISGGPSFPRISIKGGRFRVAANGTEEVLPDLELPIVILGANSKLSKTFYAAAWNPDAEASAPDCYSIGGIRPDPDSKQPQNDLCATCPQNAWGSKRTDAGVEIKACPDKKRLAVAAATDINGPIYLLEVTAAALKGLNAFHSKLKMHGIAVESAICVLSFDTTASFPKLKFDFGGCMDAQTQTSADALFGTAAVREITGDESGLAVASAAPAIAAPVAPVVAAPTPAPEPVAEPVVEAPASTFGKPAEPVAAPVVAAPVVAAPAPVVEEPVAAPVATAPAPDASTAALAGDIMALMADVADDANA